MNNSDKITLNSEFPNPEVPFFHLYSEETASSVSSTARATLIEMIRKTEPNRIAKELVNAQPMNISAEDLNEACEFLAALHNLNHPDDQWPTKYVVKS